LLLWLAFAGCQIALAAEKPLVVVAVPPQQDFIAAIAGDQVDVMVLIPAKGNHELYEPTVQQRARLGQARLYFAMDLPFEAALLRRLEGSAPQLRVIHPTARPDGTGRHDPHLWLSPPWVRLHAAQIRDALLQARLGDPRRITTGYAAFARAINQLDERIWAILSRQQVIGKSIGVVHPSWGHFASAYGLRQLALEEEGKEIAPRELAQRLDHMKSLGIPILFTEPQVPAQRAQPLASELGATLEPLDPLATPWAANLEHVADLMARAAR
jgi:zinc transport system substrate-binding protein